MAKLNEVQVVYLEGSGAARKEFAATAAIVEAAYEQVLPPIETSGIRKVVVSLRSLVPAKFERMSVLDDVAEINVGFDAGVFFEMNNHDRRRMVLDVLCRAVGELASARNWDVDSLAQACTAVRDAGIEYHWLSDYKRSPDRKLRAQVRGSIDEGGAAVKIVVVDADGTAVAESPLERLKIAHPQEIRLRSARLVWAGSTRVVLESRPIRGGDRPVYEPLALDLAPRPSAS